MQLGSGLLNTDVDGVEWLYIIGWQNPETLNMCHQTCQVG